MDIWTRVKCFSLAAAVCGVPLLLLTDLSRSFAVDWRNHAWLVAYHAAAIRSQLRVPDVVNTLNLVGMVDPAFSGQLLYSLLGAVSLVSGTELAIRIGVFGVMLLQYREIRRTVQVVGAPAYMQHAIPILVCWAVYPLTNLYQRSAVTEFFAAGLLTCSVCCLLRYPVLPERGARKEEAVRFALYFSVAATSHPITAVLGTFFCIVLMAVGWMATPGKLVSAARFAVVGAVILAVLSPWLYLVARFKSELELSPTLTSLGFFTFDSLLVRLSPFPLDPRSLVDGIRNVSTPYLNAQINTPVLLLAVLVAEARWRAFRARERVSDPSSVERTASDRYGWILCLVGAGIATTTLVVSISPDAAARLPEIFGVAQFGYRLVTYVNLGFLTCLCGLLVLGARIPLGSAHLRHAVIVLASVAALSVVQQQVYAWVISTKEKAIGAAPDALLRLPVGYYGAGAYSIRSAFRPAEPPPTGAVNLVPHGGRRFGNMQAALVRVDQAARIQTNVMAFPWNRVTVDGHLVEDDALSVWGHSLAIDVGAGTHVVGYQFKPDRAWRVLQGVSWASLGALLLAVLAPVMHRVHGRKSERGPTLPNRVSSTRKNTEWSNT